MKKQTKAKPWLAMFAAMIWLVGCGEKSSFVDETQKQASSDSVAGSGPSTAPGRAIDTGSKPGSSAPGDGAPGSGSPGSGGPSGTPTNTPAIPGTGGVTNN